MNSAMISQGIKSIRIQASHESGPFALLFLFGFPICGVSAEHVQGKPTLWWYGRESFWEQGEDDASQMEHNRLFHGAKAVFWKVF